MLSNTSQVDVEHPDLSEFPLFSNAPYCECILKRGKFFYFFFVFENFEKLIKNYFKYDNHNSNTQKSRYVFFNRFHALHTTENVALRPLSEYEFFCQFLVEMK
jgi:hypothetical protein